MISAIKNKAFYNGNGSTKLNVGNWYHFAYTYDGKNAVSYVSGEKNFEQAITGLVVIDSTTLVIGAGFWNKAHTLLARLMKFAFTNRL